MIGLEANAAPARSRLGPTAQVMGLDDEDCAAVRRHAMRLEARGDWPLALDAYRVATIAEPSRASNWRGLARAYRRLGEPLVADRVELCARIIQEKLP